MEDDTQLDDRPFRCLHAGQAGHEHRKRHLERSNLIILRLVRQHLSNSISIFNVILDSSIVISEPPSFLIFWTSRGGNIRSITKSRLSP
jgi:hypothetical protein